MFAWYWKWLGYHVCEEFTRWEIVEEEWVKKNSIGGVVVSSIPFIKRFQQRQCTLCGKVYREELK